MPQKSPIEWTDWTSNPIYVTRKDNGKRGWHCDKPSAGCGHCYAETLNGRFGTGLKFKASNADLVDFHLNEKELIKIIKLNDRLAKKGETAKMFLCDMTDIFLEQHTDEMLDKLFAVMALCPNITFQILTKRADRMRNYLNDPDTRVRIALEVDERVHQIAKDPVDYANKKLNVYNELFAETPNETEYLRPWPLDNCWLGVSVENQATADERIPFLLDVPAAVRWLSVEPMLGEIDLMTYLFSSGDQGAPEPRNEPMLPCLHWSVIGGESGNGARPFYLKYARKVIDHFQEADVPIFVKQLGKLPVGDDGHPMKLESSKGGDISEWPEDLRIRQLPEVINQ